MDTWESSCDLLISNCVFRNNSTEAAGAGGAIYCKKGSPSVVPHLIIENSTFTSNGPSAINTSARVVNIKDSLFEDNWGINGAAVSLSTVTDEVSYWENVTFVSNETTGTIGTAGALGWSGGLIDLNNCTFDGNITQSGGGACYLNSTVGMLNFDDCSFYNNIGSTNNYAGGGAVYVMKSECNFDGCTFTNNYAFNRGGGIHFNGIRATNTIYNCTFVGNTASGGDVGSAVGMENCSVTGSVVIANCTFTKNSGQGAVGIKNSNGGAGRPAKLISCISYGNTSDLYIGYKGGGFAEISNCLIGDQNTVEATTLVYSNNLVGADKDPHLGKLADNGGPTLTMAISKDSQATDLGSNPFGFLYDQRGRGFPREYGDGVDIGAFEYTPSGTRIIIR